MNTPDIKEHVFRKKRKTKKFGTGKFLPLGDFRCFQVADRLMKIAFIKLQPLVLSDLGVVGPRAGGGLEMIREAGLFQGVASR